MFSPRQSRNRRNRRYHVLDVKLNTVQRRRRWLRRLAVFLAALFTTAVAWLVLSRGGGLVLDRLVYNNPKFAIHHFEVETDGVFSVEQLRAWSDVKLGDNLIAVDLARIKRDLELIPAIESVVVERVVPHTLRIRVTERVPIAQAATPFLRGGERDDDFYLLDAKGVYLFPIEPQQRAVPAPAGVKHPRILGIPALDVRPGRPSELPQVLAALRLIRTFECSPLAAHFSLDSIDTSIPDVLEVTTSQDSEITLGLQNLDRQLRRWRAVYQHGQSQGRKLVWIDLSVSNNLPSRWAEAGPEPPPTARSHPPSTLSRKNV